MASIEKRGDKFRVVVRKEGGGSATFDTRPEAEAWGAIREAEILLGIQTLKQKKGKWTVRDALEKFRDEETPRRESEKAEVMRSNFMLRELPFVSKKIHMVTSEPIQLWSDARETAGALGSTVNRDLNFLSVVFETARKKWKWILTNPVHDVERPDNPEARNRRVSQDEIETMLAALGYVRGTIPVSKCERLAVAFLLALEIGMRKGEMVKTLWSNVHTDHIFLPAAICKNRTARSVPFTPEACRLIALLPRHDVKLLGDLDIDAADVLWRRERDKTKIVDLHFHDSRHEAVTRLAGKLGVLALAKMIGHKDIKNLQIYYNPTMSELSARLAGM